MEEAEGFGGNLIRIVSFFGLFCESSPSPKPMTTAGPRGGLGGGLLVCSFGFDLRSFDMPELKPYLVQFQLYIGSHPSVPFCYRL